MSEKKKAAPEIVKLLVANGALLEAPIYENHHRGSNWLAVIDVDKASPGGLSRRFANRGRGECMYDVEQVAVFDALEFGADYTTSVGNKRRDRWYGIVIGKTEGSLVLERCATGARAVVRSKEARVSLKDRKEALKLERDALVERAAKLEGEIMELEAPGAPVSEETAEEGKSHGS